MMNEPLVLKPDSQADDGPRLERITYPENPRYRRIKFISQLMDQSIVLPSGFRIGLDPLIGLVPGVGDALSALVSLYLVYQCARLGLRKRVLLLMLGNIVLDTFVGSFPVLGDLFDAVWKSNMRNLRLLDKHWHPMLRERSAPRIIAWFAAVAGVLMIAAGALFYLTAKFTMAVLIALGSLFRP